jgi:hypothetical protein
MSNLDIVLIIIIIILIFHSDIKETFENIFLSKKICNNVDGRCYEISIKYEENTYEDASKHLAIINKKLIEFLRYLRNKYIWNNNPNKYRTFLVERLLSLYNQDNLIENAPDGIVNTSYVEDKGKIFAICLREKTTGRYLFEDIETLLFVALHELSHIANITWKHGNEYWHDFKIILEEAVASGIYNPVNYKKNNVNYCGLNITYNPYFDEGLITK